MFADGQDTRSERAAVLALMERRPLAWNRLAGAIEEAGGALEMLDQLDAPKDDQLFSLDDGEPRQGLAEAEQLLDEYEAEGIGVLTVLDESYPPNLRDVHDRPPALFVGGALSPADERSVAVVGSRKASEEGIATARSIAEALVAADYVVVSGLARGIDTAAHTGALDAGGRTVAVIGTGLRENFPKENVELQARISRESAVVSQFWPDQGPRKWTFPQRNAVMSGFARATVVVEAGRTSGARMQARIAIEHGRPAFLMRSLLTHAWAQDAKERPSTYVVESGEEVLEHLGRLYADELVLTA